MGIVFRQSIKTTIVIFTGAVLGALLLYISMQYLPQVELGFTRNLTNQAVVGGQFIMFGLPVSMTVFIHRYDDNDKRKGLLLTLCFIIPFVFLAFATLLYCLFHDQVISLFKSQDIPLIRRYFIWLPIFSLLYISQTLLEQYLNSQMKVALATFMREVVLRVLYIGVIILYAVGFIDFDKLVAGMVLIYLIPIFCLLYFASRTKSFQFNFDLKAFSSVEYKELRHFTRYQALLVISLNMMGFLDSLLLAPLDKTGLQAVAIYTPAVFILSVMQIPYKAMVTASFPVLARAFKDNDMVKAKDIFTRSSINILIGGVAMAVIIGCNLPNAVAISKKGYEAITPLVLIMMIGRLIDMSTGMNDQVLSASKYYKYNFYLSGLLVVSMVIFDLIFIPKYGIYGAAWGTTFSFGLYNIFKMFFLWKKLRMQPFSKKSLLVLLAGFFAASGGYFMPYIYNPIIDTAIRTVLIGVIYLLFLLWFKPSPDMVQYMASIRQNKRIF